MTFALPVGPMTHTEWPLKGTVIPKETQNGRKDEHCDAACICLGQCMKKVHLKKKVVCKLLFSR